jgi:hypothetical protein
MTAWGIPNWEGGSANNFNADSVSDDAADFIAGAICKSTKDGEVIESRLGKSSAFGAGSDWVAVFDPKCNPGYRQSLENYFPRKNVREALIRQTWGLFRPEDSLFTIVVVAQAIKEGPSGSVGKFSEDDDTIVGEKRAVALVWRDPFPIGTLHHEMSIIMYKTLND